ncbi:MAG: aldolase [Clostridia bacterium]|nr:aldolase [Clostridia bacterium]
MKTLREKIENRERTTGFLVNFNEVGVAKLAGCAGYDLIWIDTEHSPISYETLLAQIIAVKSTGTAAVVRVPQHDLTATKKTLDMGPDGIIFPMVHSYEEAKELISWTLYPPHGNRGFGPQNAIDYGYRDPVQFMKDVPKTLVRFIQIEHRGAIEELDEILKIPFIDGFIFGPNDLAGSYGMPGEVFDPKITALIKEAAAKIRAAGKYSGLATGDTRIETLTHWRDMGIDLLVAGSDFDLLCVGTRENRKLLDSIMK